MFCRNVLYQLRYDKVHGISSVYMPAVAGTSLVESPAPLTVLHALMDGNYLQFPDPLMHQQIPSYL
jgi:hypothetical protein